MNACPLRGRHFFITIGVMFDELVDNILRFFGLDGKPVRETKPPAGGKCPAGKPETPVSEERKEMQSGFNTHTEEKEMMEQVANEEKSVLDRAEEVVTENEKQDAADRAAAADDEADDALLAQIDAFRAKAQELSNLIQNKQAKVADLENMVSSREKQNEKLRAELELTRKQYREIEEKLDARFDTMKDGLSQDMGKYTEDLLEQNKAAQAPVLEKVESVGTALNSVDTTVADVNKSVSGLKEQIFDKVHTESVQSYKNLQEFIKENDKSEDNRLSILTAVEKVKGAVTFVGILSVINMGMLVCMLLHILGVF